MAPPLPLLRGGFRPFFLGGALWSVVALALWLPAFLGHLELPTAFDALAWHRHEMLFGFVGAVIAGFLLTAIPNWTGRPPIAGAPLAALAALWLAARLALLLSSEVGLWAAAALDVGFFVILGVAGGRELRAAGNRNLPLIGLVLLFAAADALDYAAGAGLVADAEAGFRAGIALVVLLISLIGGRIVPSFTRNWLAGRGVASGLPAQMGRYDQATLAVTAIAVAAWTLVPDAPGAGIALAAAGVLQIVRLLRWRGWRTLADPLVLILHIGYAWIPAGLLLLSWSILAAGVPRTAALHALTAGAMATMTLAVMTRASLGHTGRALEAGPATVTVFALVTLGALVRVVAPFGLIDYRAGIEGAGVMWGGAFALFFVAYAPMLVRAKRGDPAG